LNAAVTPRLKRPSAVESGFLVRSPPNGVP
jgi:hypothetical protein